MVDEATLMKTFGSNLAKLRKQHGMTQGQLAIALDVSLSSIAFIETGKRWPRPATLAKLASCLDVRVADFFRGF